MNFVGEDLTGWKKVREGERGETRRCEASYRTIFEIDTNHYDGDLAGVVVFLLLFEDTKLRVGLSKPEILFWVDGK